MSFAAGRFPANTAAIRRSEHRPDLLHQGARGPRRSGVEIEVTWRRQARCHQRAIAVDHAFDGAAQRRLARFLAGLKHAIEGLANDAGCDLFGFGDLASLENGLTRNTEVVPG